MLVTEGGLRSGVKKNSWTKAKGRRRDGGILKRVQAEIDPVWKKKKILKALQKEGRKQTYFLDPQLQPARNGMFDYETKKRCSFQLKKYFLNIMHHLHAWLLGSMILALLVFFLSFSSLLPPFPGIRGWLVSKWIAAAAAVSPFLHISSTDFNQKGKKIEGDIDSQTKFSSDV